MRPMIADFPELECLTLVTGAHLMAEMGNSVDLIRKDGFPVTAEVPLSPAADGKGAWSRAMGEAMIGFAQTLEKIDPDVLLVYGDRAETLTAVVAACYMGIPVAHVQAGDKSGHIDDAARHAIAKLAHIHFASCQDSADRLVNLGEQPERIHNTGAPQLDDLDRDFSASFTSHEGAVHNLTGPYLLLVQHPVMAERDEAVEQMKAALDAALETGLRIFWIYPNTDLGYGGILNLIEDYKTHSRIVPITNLERDDYMTLMFNAAALVGNSSSGILEAPTFRTPVVNIGSRQRGRPQADNILNCDTGKDAVLESLLSALNDPDVKRRCERAINPYGDGKSGPRICGLLRDVVIDRALMDKQTVY